MPRLSPDRTLPAAITNLRLSAALKHCGAIGVADAFDKSPADILYVYDDRALGYTDWTDMEPEFVSKCFKVSNPNQSIVSLLPLDGRILTGAKVIVGGVCDGMLLSENEMCLVEFKTNVISSSYLTIIQRAKEAVGQLWHTFDCIVKPKCAAQSKNIEQLLSVDFYVVFDKGLEVTGIKSELMDLQIQFLMDNAYPLYFDNEKSFQ